MRNMSFQKAMTWLRWTMMVWMLILVGLPAATAAERVVLGEYFTNQY